MSHTDPPQTPDDDVTAVYHALSEPAAESDARRAPAAKGATLGTGVLAVTRGPVVGAQFVLTQPVTAAGRHPNSDVFLDDITVSRHHAEFRWLDDEYWIVDTSSLNGTYVNRARVQSLPLSSGDQIQIGKFRLTFTYQPQAEQSP
jgi:pSer/pThr/pTyr-binding forkhead associated (FHA) protein